jgi:hypothetical protein
LANKIQIKNNIPSYPSVTQKALAYYNEDTELLSGTNGRFYEVTCELRFDFPNEDRFASRKKVLY